MLDKDGVLASPPDYLQGISDQWRILGVFPLHVRCSVATTGDKELISFYRRNHLAVEFRLHSQALLLFVP